MAGIYIHIPFCSKACHYCDFHFSTSFKTLDYMILAINKELYLRRNYLKNKKIKTIYFGGGTPSVLKSNYIEKIIKTIYDNFVVVRSPEVTLEANPNDLKKEKIKKYINLGVNRISLGGQSFFTFHLKNFNRTHTGKDVIDSIQLIQDSGINNINLDLMYGFSGLTNKSWITNLNKAINLNIPHLSCYALTIEKGTVFHNMVKKGNMKITSDKKVKEQFLIMRDVLLSNNFIHYEISNFSKKKHQSQHNLGYWNGEKYLGVGPSAHSYNGLSRQWNISNNTKYINLLKMNKLFFEEEILTKKNIVNEYILTKLRTNQGVSFEILKNLTNNKEMEYLEKKIQFLDKQFLVEIKKNKFFLTLAGMILCDKITSDLFLI